MGLAKFVMICLGWQQTTKVENPIIYKYCEVKWYAQLQKDQYKINIKKFQLDAFSKPHFNILCHKKKNHCVVSRQKISSLCKT